MIYFDHAAATPVAPEILEKMLPYLSGQFANPSSIYSDGQKSRAAIDEARETVAKILHCKSKEIF